MKINENYKNLEESYLFSTIAKKVDEYTKAHPEAKVIKMGIGDVTLPICQKAADAFAKAAMEQGKAATFHGYGPEQGYDFLRVAVQKYYASFQVEVAAEDIFISDGAKSDVGNILDLFDADNTVLIPDPVYPVYMDTNVMAGRKIVFMDANVENGFLPMPPKGQKADIIYLCSPNNPTGGVYNREQLKEWVDYANEQDAILLFDAAYESFVADPALPRSIFEIEGAKTCAIEFCSLSKLASFTGTRCGYTVVPSELERGGSSIRKMWLRRQTTKFNGGTARRRGSSFTGGHGTVPRAPGRIPHQCEDHDRDLKRAWHLAHRRRKFTVYLDAVPERHEILGVFRRSACQGKCGRHTGQRIW